MAGEVLGKLGMHAATRQVGDERVSEGMEVDDAGGRTVPQVIRLLPPLAFLGVFHLFQPGLASIREVVAKHLGRFVRNTEHRRAFRDCGDMLGQEVGQLRQQRNYVLAPALAVRGRHGDGRLVGGKIE
ncbi:MAG TPA: hypothetical protein P5159_02245 [Phycisphaerae bacterium]|nr:hypothetical protein [Phycisphaerae bacterium]